MREVEIVTEWIERTASDGTTVLIYVARPASRSEGPGMLVFQDAFGVSEHIRDITERFARQGYISAAPALFHRTDATRDPVYSDFGVVMAHIGALTDDGQSADIRAAYDWLTGEGKATSVGSVGYCMGGRTSFLANTILPLQAAVCYYGSGIAPSEHKLFPPLIDRVAALSGPTLLFWGDKDAHIGPDQRHAVEVATKEAGKTAVHVLFTQADHAFFSDVRPNYEPTSAKLSWTLTLDFLSTYL
ncbi:MAG: dienelactone hydrolase family protein [Capsulimonadaceae bacterium]